MSAEAMERIFLDTNILVYAYDTAADARKRDLARDLLRQALLGTAHVLSAQVMSEFLVTVTRKFATPMALPAAAEVLRTLQALEVCSIDVPLVLRATECQERYQTSYWDGLIIAAAERLRCRYLFSEDLSAGQGYFGVTVVDPFAG